MFEISLVDFHSCSKSLQFVSYNSKRELIAKTDADPGCHGLWSGCHEWQQKHEPQKYNINAIYTHYLSAIVWEAAAAAAGIVNNWTVILYRSV